MAKLSDFLIKTDTKYIFNGDTCSINVPQRYQAYDVLNITDEVSTLGIFDISINEKEYFKLVLPMIVTMKPSGQYTKKINEDPYFVFTFQKGDEFITDRTLIKQSFILFSMFKEFIVNGNFPYFLTYEELGRLFDRSQSLCDERLNAPHAIFEMIFAHLSRDARNPNIFYRHTDMKEPPLYIGLKNVGYAPTSTTAKVIGSYLMEGLNSAIVNPATRNSEIENILRS